MWHVVSQEDWLYVVRTDSELTVVGGFGLPYPTVAVAQIEADRRNYGGELFPVNCQQAVC